MKSHYDVNETAAELRLTKKRPASICKKRYLLQERMLAAVNKVMKTKC